MGFGFDLQADLRLVEDTLREGKGDCTLPGNLHVFAFCFELILENGNGTRPHGDDLAKKQSEAV